MKKIIPTFEDYQMNEFHGGTDNLALAIFAYFEWIISKEIKDFSQNGAVKRLFKNKKVKKVYDYVDQFEDEIYHNIEDLMVTALAAVAEGTNDHNNVEVGRTHWATVLEEIVGGKFHQFHNNLQYLRRLKSDKAFQDDIEEEVNQGL